MFLATYLIGPVLAFLPKRWRQGLAMSGQVHWERAATLSGMLEILGAIVGLGYWYLYEMSRLISNGMEAASSGKLGPGATDHQVSGAALLVFALHPVTWLLFYLFIEGAVRLCGAAFTENVLGTLPLAVVDRLWLWGLRRGREPEGMQSPAEGDSLIGSVREWMMVSQLAELPDELRWTKEGEDEMLEIGASRRKEGWLAPSVVRVDEMYYRLEEVAVVNGVARPFVYRLRRLPAGVPGRGVILYKGGRARERKTSTV